MMNSPFAYIFRLKNGACDLLEFASEAMALEHAELNLHRYKSVWDRDGRCVWRTWSGGDLPFDVRPAHTSLRRDN